jgi:flagellum-specific peptidoglycan hydrolase FlgJ
MRTIIYEKIPSMFAMVFGFLNFILAKLKDNILLIFVLILMIEPNQDNQGQIVLSFPTFSFKSEQTKNEFEPEDSELVNLSNTVESVQSNPPLVQNTLVSSNLNTNTKDLMTIEKWKKIVSSKGISVKELPKFEYLKRYAQVSVDEMHIHKIPASITIAQALLESNAGRSNLAIKHKNHFGIKCYDQKNLKGACVPFYSDGPNDRFRHYESVWSCFRDHSYFLKRSRYSSLYELNINDYKGWSKGLKAAGYATDPGYSKKLIKLIEHWDLHLLDQVK